MNNIIKRKNKLLDIVYSEDFKSFNNLLIEGLDSNDTFIDTIIFERYPGENTIIKIYDILFDHGYKFKNNIIFYIFCVYLSYSKYTYQYYLDFYPEICKNKKRPKIQINQEDIENLLLLGINKSIIIERLQEEINTKKSKLFPQFDILPNIYEISKTDTKLTSNSNILDYNDFINEIINNKICLDNIETTLSINYLNLLNISWKDFIREYQLEPDIQINFYIQLFLQNYQLDSDFLIYFLKNGNSLELLDLYISEGFFTYNQNKIMTIAVFSNYKFFNYIFNLKFIVNDKYYKKIINDSQNNLENLINKNFIKQNILINDLDMIQTYSFDPNYIEYDRIALKDNFFDYNNLTNESEIDLEYNCDYDNEQIISSNYSGDIRIIQLYNILFDYDYKIKNNIVFYVLCLNITSLLSNKNISEKHVKIINELVNKKEFKIFTTKKIIPISNVYLDIGKKILIPRIKLLNKLKYKINNDCGIKLPKFIFRIKF